MSGVTRRLVLAGGVCAGGLAAAGTLAPPRLQARIHDHLSELFGEDIADSRGGRDFAERYAVHFFQQITEIDGTTGGAARAAEVLLGEDLGAALFGQAYRLIGHDAAIDAGLRRRVLEKFLTSTNFIEVDGAPEKVELIALFSPYDAPCLNQLARPSAAA